MTAISFKKNIPLKKGPFFFLCTALLFGTIDSAYGQNTRHLQFGIKSGLTISNLYGDDSRMLDMGMIADSLAPGARFAFPLGLSLNTRFNAYWGAGVELFYSMKGKKDTYSRTENNVTGSLDYLIKFDYFEIPILLKIFVPGESDFNSHFYAGFSPAILGAAKEQMKIEVEGREYYDTSFSFYNYCTAVDYGIVVGYGGFISEKTVDVTFDLRCTVGLLPLMKKEGYETEEPDFRNWQIMVLLGFGMRPSEKTCFTARQ